MSIAATEARKRFCTMDSAVLSDLEWMLRDLSRSIDSETGELKYEAGMHPRCHREIRWKQDSSNASVSFVLRPHEKCELSLCTHREGRCSVTMSSYAPSFILGSG